MNHMVSILIIAPLHTPEEMRFFSNLGHWIEGAIICIAALIAIVQAAGYLKSGRLNLLWPGILIFAGIFLPLFMVFHHGIDDAGRVWSFVLGDHQQQQHLALAALILFGGLSELFYRLKPKGFGALKFGFALALVSAGILFLVHEQHGTGEAVEWAVMVHRYLGAVLILAGIFKAAESVWKKKFKWLIYVWAILLLAAAVLLMGYREPEGAYRHDGTVHAPVGVENTHH